MLPMLSPFVLFLHGIGRNDLGQNLAEKGSKPLFGVGRTSPLSRAHVKLSKLECMHREVNAEQMASHCCTQ